VLPQGGCGRLTDGLEILLADPGKPNDILIAHDDRRGTIDDSTHGEFRLERHTNLSHDKEVEWCVQRDCDLRSDRHATAREREHDRLLIFVLRQRRGELASRIPPIIERHGTLLVSRTRDLCLAAQTAAKVALEPARGMAGHRLQRSRLRKQVARPGTISSDFGPRRRENACSLSSMTPKSIPPTIKSVGVWIRSRASPAKSGRPPLLGCAAVAAHLWWRG
jgi:hypothetical protein